MRWLDDAHDGDGDDNEEDHDINDCDAHCEHNDSDDLQQFQMMMIE